MFVAVASSAVVGPVAVWACAIPFTTNMRTIAMLGTINFFKKGLRIGNLL